MAGASNLAKLRDGIAALVTVAILGVALPFGWSVISGARDREAAVNPDIFPAFRRLERTCLRWNNDHPLCGSVVDAMTACGPDCTARDYYCILGATGVQLPPYYKPNSRFAAGSPCR